MNWNSTDELMFFAGNHDTLYQKLGAHLVYNNEGVIGTLFRVYAPGAKEVRLLIEKHFFDGSKALLKKSSVFGVWEIYDESDLSKQMYKYQIISNSGEVLVKSDPFGYFQEVRPNNASIVYQMDGYKWCDLEYLKKKEKVYNKPFLIYEIHLGSWRKKNGIYYSYAELADLLIPYLLEQGFTHVEFMPIYEYPYDPSWGYQGTGFFAATSRFGEPKDLMHLIDRLHQANIGVIIDWVLGHICKDSHGLYQFDGTYLFEYQDAERRENLTWGTANLDFSKGISRSFMLSALNFWISYFHIDGFRIDAVSNLFYYLGNQDKGVNNEAIAFLKEISKNLFKKDDRILFMAEDSTTYPMVTWPVAHGGVGFNYKWNMGFMHDTLFYFQKDPIFRKYHHDKITFSLTYAFNEQFVLPFSHDEVVYVKGSMLNKMAGDYQNKFNNYRLFLTYFLTVPGKKLLFMGAEFGQFSEWNFETELDWFLFKYPMHDSLNRFFKDLVHVYKNNKELYQLDHDPKSFRWIDVDNKEQSVFSFIRYSETSFLIIILNMNDVYYDQYRIGVPKEGEYEEILNSDKDIYSGQNRINSRLKTEKISSHNFNDSLNIKLAPLSSLIIKFNS